MGTDIKLKHGQNHLHFTNKSKKPKVLLVICIVCVAVCLVLFGAQSQGLRLWPLSAIGNPTSQVEIEVVQGSGAASVAQALFDKHLINNKAEFVQELLDQNIATKIQPGTYVIEPGASEQDICALLSAGPNSQKGKLVLPEGLTVNEVAAHIEESLGIPASEVLDVAYAHNFVENFAFLQEAVDDSLEGFLFGSTYDFTGQNPSASDVITAILARYEQSTQGLNMDGVAERISAQYNTELSGYDILKMASLMEKEGKESDEYPLIASVFYNRLAIGMNLQSDATLGYVLGREPTAEELLQDETYNTYTRAGLPPTPICSPSLECIEAALNPASTSYYYFFIYDDGNYSNHTFSETYEQHQAAIDDANRHKQEAGA